MVIPGFLNRFARIASEKSEVVAASMVFLVVAMMVIPMPPGLLDFFIAFNITLSGLLVIIAIMLPAPLAFSSFPAVLLISTLFRLAISVSTTRLILLNGYSGHIVEAFGEFVIGGNVAVGIIIFLIIAVVNFIVVTKGSERVAEVAARFSLDGMPGKQMSIDSDMRAGAIDQNEAKERRARLERESQLFGAMDGAIKFVKGDAIAGFIIVFINLLGGLALGVIQKGMDLSAAVHRYSLLSVGDGLVALIPSLLVSIAAGMIVTRVSQSDNKASSVAADMAREVAGNPKAMLMAMFFAVAFSMIPGMPMAIFLGLAISLALPWLLLRGQLKADPVGTPLQPSATMVSQKSFVAPVEDRQALAPIMPVMVELDMGLSDADVQRLQNVVKVARNRLFDVYGISCPAVHFVRAALKAGDALRISLMEVPRLSIPYPGPIFIVCSRHSELERMGVSVIPINDAFRGASLSCVSHDDALTLEAAGFKLEPYENYMLEIVTDLFLAEIKTLFSPQELVNWMAQQEQRSPDMVKDLQRVLPNARIHEILIRLLGERVSLRNFEAIASTLTDWASRERDLVILTEHVRIALGAQICHAHAVNGVLHGFVVSPELENTIRETLRQTATGSYLDIADERRNQIIHTIYKRIPYYLENGCTPVLFTPGDCRRYMRRVYDQSITWLQVISFSEVPPHLQVDVVGELTET